MSESSLQALARLRDGSTFDWSALTAVFFVLYVYSAAIRDGRTGDVALGLAFWALELLWEMFNGLVLHWSGYAALWTVAGPSSLVIYVGLNVEISLMFMVAPIIVLNLLPASPRATIAGVPSRILIPTFLGLLSVLVECILNRWSVLLWAWRFWGWPHVWSIAVVYIGSFWALAWCHDHLSHNAKLCLAVGFVAAALAAHGILAGVLGWI